MRIEYPCDTDVGQRCFLLVDKSGAWELSRAAAVEVRTAVPTSEL